LKVFVLSTVLFFATGLIIVTIKDDINLILSQDDWFSFLFYALFIGISVLFIVIISLIIVSMPYLSTLELMLSVLIIIVLIISAGLIYSDYKEKAKISEVMTLVVGLKTKSVLYYSHYGQFPTTIEELGDEVTKGTYVESITLEKTAFTAKMQTENNEQELVTFRPALLKNEPNKIITWVCGYEQPPAHYVVLGENKTNVPRSYLPSTCR